MKRIIIAILYFPLLVAATVEPLTPGVGQYCSQWQTGYTQTGDIQEYLPGFSGWWVHVPSNTRYWEVETNLRLHNVLCLNEVLVMLGTSYVFTICPWTRGAYCFSDVISMYCSAPTTGHSCFESPPYASDLMENQGRCLPGCSALGACTNLPANAFFTGNATTVTDPSTCPWSCNTGYYALQGVCIPIASVIVPGQCTSDASCYSMLSPADETFKCSGNLFAFDDYSYTQGTCQIFQGYYIADNSDPYSQTLFTYHGSGIVAISNANAVSAIINFTSRFELSNTNVLDFNFGYGPIQITEAGTSNSIPLKTFDIFAQSPTNQYLIFNQTYEIPANTFYIKFIGDFSAQNPLEFFNVRYSWKYQCAYCSANQYCSGCSSTSKGTCTPCQFGGVSPAGSVGAGTCIPNCPHGYYQQGSTCIACTACLNGYTNPSCSGTVGPGVCQKCINS